MKRLVVLLACIVFVCGICGDLGAETMLFFKNASVARGDVVRWELQPSSLGEVTFQGVGLKLADGVNPTLAARITAFPERFYLDTNYDPPKLMERLDDESEVEVDVDPPSVPTGVTVSPIVRGISVAVDHPADEEEVEFEVHASATQGFTPGPSTVKAFGSVSPFLIGNLDPPGPYYVRVRAKDGAGNWSDYSSEASGQAGIVLGDDVEEHSIEYKKFKVAYAQVKPSIGTPATADTVVPAASPDDWNYMYWSAPSWLVVQIDGPLAIYKVAIDLLHQILSTMMGTALVQLSIDGITWTPVFDMSYADFEPTGDLYPLGGGVSVKPFFSSGTGVRDYRFLFYVSKLETEGPSPTDLHVRFKRHAIE